MYEIAADGKRNEWGTVLVWEPPARIVMTWAPGEDKSVLTEVEIRFARGRRRHALRADPPRLGAVRRQTRERTATATTAAGRVLTKYGGAREPSLRFLACCSAAWSPIDFMIASPTRVHERAAVLAPPSRGSAASPSTPVLKCGMT